MIEEVKKILQGIIAHTLADGYNDVDTLAKEICQLFEPKSDEGQVSPLEQEIKEIVLEIRQYLCNTEFAPEPFTEPVDMNKLTVEFPNQILTKVASYYQNYRELDPDQSLPDWIKSRYWDSRSEKVYIGAQQDMLKDNWKKVK